MKFSFIKSADGSIYLLLGALLEDLYNPLVLCRFISPSGKVYELSPSFFTYRISEGLMWELK